MPGDARGLIISLGGFGEDHFVECQIGNRFPEPGVLLLQLLHSFDLVRLQPVELFAPAVIGQLRHADLADGIGYRCSLRGQHIDLPKLGDDLFRLVFLAYFRPSSGKYP